MYIGGIKVQNYKSDFNFSSGNGYLKKGCFFLLTKFEVIEMSINLKLKRFNYLMVDCKTEEL